MVRSLRNVLTQFVIELPDQVDSKALESKIREMEELHRMQLAGISTATQQNTEASKLARIGKENCYWTPTYQDVCNAVDRECCFIYKSANL